MDVAQEELTDELVNEVNPLLLLHNEEVRDKDEVDYTLEWYRSAQVEGRYKFFTLRKDGELVGYAGFFTVSSPQHRAAMFAVCDLIYVVQKYRGRYGMKLLLDAAETEFKRLSIKYISMSVRPHHDFGPILKRRGYETKEIVYLKEL